MKSLYNQWSEMAYEFDTKEEYDKFWNDYLPRETKFYKYILTHLDEDIEGTIADLAKKFSEDKMTIIGFVDGINTSLKDEDQVDIESITEQTHIKLSVIPEKLFYNMHVAKADWLYGLKEWDLILTEEKRKEIEKEYKKSKTYVNEDKIGRNDPCPCGSGKKYKKCCGKNV